MTYQNYSLKQLQQIDAAHHLHPFTDHKAFHGEGGPRVITHAEGVWIWDAKCNKLLDGMAGSGGEKFVEALTRAVPMRRLGEPQDIAAAVAFLASEQAGYVTGQTLSVSGGLTMA